MRSPRQNLFIWLLTTYLGGLLMLWGYIQFSHNINGIINYFFAFAYGLMPLCGGTAVILKIKNSKLKEVNRNLFVSLLFLSLGLICWGSGETIWSYYNLVLHIDVPYPSLADVMYVLTYPTWSVGLLYLSKALDLHITIERKIVKWPFIIVLGIIISSIYYLFLVLSDLIAKENAFMELRTFFDIAYPLWDTFLLICISLIFALAIAEKKLGKYKVVLITLFIGLIGNFIADSLFSFTNAESFYNGSYVDLAFVIELYFMTLGIFILAQKSSVNN